MEEKSGSKVFLAMDVPSFSLCRFIKINLSILIVYYSFEQHVLSFLSGPIIKNIFC